MSDTKDAYADVWFDDQGKMHIDALHGLLFPRATERWDIGDDDDDEEMRAEGINPCDLAGWAGQMLFVPGCPDRVIGVA